MNITDISDLYIIWRSFVKGVKVCPYNHDLGRQACIAQMRLVTAQAIYLQKYKQKD